MSKNWKKIYSTTYLHKAEIAKAVLQDNDIEAMILNKRDSMYLIGEIELYALQKDILKAMEDDSEIPLANLRVDGGACANNHLMQFQADILDSEVHRPEVIESTAMGAAFLAGIQVGLWKQEDVDQNRPMNRIFKPTFDRVKRKRLYKKWKQAVERTKGWDDK